VHRFGPNGLYLLDEPEAALSVPGCVALLARMHDLVAAGSQFILATHSPILLAYPGATIYPISHEATLERVDYDDTEAVRLHRDFLADPGRYLHHLFAEECERFSGSWSEAVCGEPLDLPDRGVEHVVDDDRPQLPVKSVERVEVLVQECDRRLVDAPGGVQELAQFAGGIIAVAGGHGPRWCEEGGDWFAEDSFEQSRGGRPERAEMLAAGESLQVPQAQGARFLVVPGEDFGVLHEFLVGQG